ncbi:MAG: hypothetical protein PF637_02360 [Spirochaetes bacterium]|jgi:hypothetical protein|nr:hypothetical protein [Spirochaetota bacterium]
MRNTTKTKKTAKTIKPTKVTFSEKQILNSKTPDEYIHRSLNSDVSRGQKTVLCRQWKEKTGFTSEDIQYARNRHPYWKQKKMSGWQDRNQKRWSEHDYRTVKKNRVEAFEADIIEQFCELNKKDKKGNYLMKDWEIAKELQLSIPSVQHWRRKYLLVLRLADAIGKKPTRKFILKYMTRHENGLRREYNELVS